MAIHDQVISFRNGPAGSRFIRGIVTSLLPSVSRQPAKVRILVTDVANQNPWLRASHRDRTVYAINVVKESTVSTVPAPRDTSATVRQHA